MTDWVQAAPYLGQSFRILQNLSLSVTPIRWLGSVHEKRGQNRDFERGFICFEG